MPEMSPCPSCNAPTPVGARFCVACGHKLSASTKKLLQSTKKIKGTPCPNCGHVNSPPNKFCIECGHSLKGTQLFPLPGQEKARVSRMLAGGRYQEYRFDNEILIGAAEGEICVSEDSFLSGKHAAIVRQGDRYVLKDFDSLNGTFIRVKGEVELKPGDIVMLGGQVFRFEV